MSRGLLSQQRLIEVVLFYYFTETYVEYNNDPASVHIGMTNYGEVNNNIWNLHLYTKAKANNINVRVCVGTSSFMIDFWWLCAHNTGNDNSSVECKESKIVSW